MNILTRKPLAAACFSGIAVSVLSYFAPAGAKIAAAVLTATAALCLLFLKNKRSNAYITVLLSLLLSAAAAISSYLYFDVYAENILSLSGSAHGVEASVLSVGERYGRTYAELQIVSTDGRPLSCRAELYAGKAEDIRSGDIISFNANVEGYADDGLFGSAAYLRSRGYLLRLYTEGETPVRVTGKAPFSVSSLFAGLRKRICAAYDKYLPNEISGLIKALLTGDRDGISAGIRSDFSYIGLPHILAISGMHFAVLFGMLSAFLKKAVVPLRLRCLLLTVCALAFSALCGFSSSVLRAGCMFIVSQLCVAAGGRSDSMTSLAFAVYLIFLFDVKAVFDTGLWMSFCAALGIIVFLPLQKSLSGKPAALRAVLSSAAVTLSATLFTLPIVWLCFGRYSAAAVPANLVAAPAVGAAICLAPFIFFFSGIPAVAAAFAAPVSFICRLLLFLVRAAASVRGMTVPLDVKRILPLAAVTAVCAAIAFEIGKNKRKTVIVAFFCFCAAASLFTRITGSKAAETLKIAPEYTANACFGSEGGGLKIEIKGDESYDRLKDVFDTAREKYGFYETEVLRISDPRKGTAGRLAYFCRDMKIFEISVRGGDVHGIAELISFCEENHIELRFE